MKNKSKDEVLSALLQLKKELGHEPTAKEIDKCRYIPSSRQLQRRWGGLQKLRGEVGFKVKDHTKGATRSAKAKEVNDRCDEYEARILMEIIKKYHDPENFTTDVIREYAYQHYMEDGDWYKNIKCDVAIVQREKKHVIMFDFFYPADEQSAQGCIRSKLRKMEKYPVSLIPPTTHGVVLVCMNNSILLKPGNYPEVEVLLESEFRAKYL